MITTEYIVGAAGNHTASLRSPSHVAKINHKSKKSRKSKKSKKSHCVNGDKDGKE